MTPQEIEERKKAVATLLDFSLVYEELRDLVISAGIPACEILYAHGQTPSTIVLVHATSASSPRSRSSTAPTPATTRS